MPETKIDHYKIWEIVPKPANNRAYDIIDQFHDEPLTITLTDLVWIANPVHKSTRKVASHPSFLHREEHFTGYRLADDTDEPERPVKITNQLSVTGATWRIKDPRYFLIPAAKSDIAATAPRPLAEVHIDHFLCYEVTQGRNIQKQLFLNDQFDQTDEETYKLIPKFLGVPAQKDTESRINEEVHLAIYLILEQPKHSFAIRDQRDSVIDLETQSNRYLAVPSKKEVSASKVVIEG
jgi:hypothetical protein